METLIKQLGEAVLRDRTLPALYLFYCYVRDEQIEKARHLYQFDPAALYQYQDLVMQVLDYPV